MIKATIPTTSMVNPSTDALLEKTDSRYGLVVLAARRARQLLSGDELKVKSVSKKNVTNALEEILEGKITYEIKERDGVIENKEEEDSLENLEDADLTGAVEDVSESEKGAFLTEKTYSWELPGE